MMNLDKVIPNLKKIQKYINPATHHLSSSDISIFSPEISNIFYNGKYRWKLHCSTWFLIVLTFVESLKVVLINMNAILIMMSAKLATPSLLETKIFRNKSYDVIYICIIYIYMCIYNTSPSKSYLLNQIKLVMWPKFGKPTISMGEVFITSIL